MSKEIFTIRTEGEFESAHSIREYIETEDGHSLTQVGLKLDPTTAMFFVEDL